MYQPFPAGCAYISAVLKHDSFNVNYFVWDLSRTDYDNEIGLKQALSKHSIDVVMCGGMVHDYKRLLTLFKAVKSISSSIITIQGGTFVTYSPNEAMKLLPECDIGVIGEGEITICELMRTIEDNGDINSVKGIIYRDNLNQTIMTEMRIEVPDLGNLPMPDYEGLFGEWLKNSAHLLPTVSSRGCNNNCTFCTQAKRYRERPVEKVFEEIDYYTSKYNFREVAFQNDYFSTEEENLNNFCARAKKSGVPFRLYTRISPKLTLDVLTRLREAGVHMIFYGLESADNTVLKSMRKGITVELMIRVLEATKAARINTCGCFIFGDTAENLITAQATLNFVKEHRDLFHHVEFFMIRLFPGSFLHQKAVDEGKIDPIAHIQNLCPTVNVSSLSDEEYSYLNDFYFNYFYYTEYLVDLNIENINFERTNNSKNILFNFDCVTCGKRIDFHVDLKKTNYDDSKIFCECGERLMLDFFHHLIDKNKIYEVLKNYKTAFYGIGGLFYKHYYKCELTKSNHDYFLLNGSMRVPCFSDALAKKIHSPDAIDEFGIEKVIVTLSGAYDVDAVVSGLKKKYPGVEFVLWCDV